LRPQRREERVGLMQVPGIDELAEDAKSMAATGSKVKIVFTLASSQFDEVSFDSIDEYIDQAMGAADLLNALLYGGTVQGYDVPSIDQICDGLRIARSRPARSEDRLEHPFRGRLI